MREWIIGDDFVDDYLLSAAKSQGYLQEMVRCKDCEWLGNPLMCPCYKISPQENGFCYCAERRKK